VVRMSRHVPPRPRRVNNPLVPFSGDPKRRGARAGGEAGLGRRETASVAHMRPGGRLSVGEHLAQVVPIMVNPLVEQLVHPKPADLWMPAPALQIGGA